MLAALHKMGNYGRIEMRLQTMGLMVSLSLVLVLGTVISVVADGPDKHEDDETILFGDPDETGGGNHANHNLLPNEVTVEVGQLARGSRQSSSWLNYHCQR